MNCQNGEKGSSVFRGRHIAFLFQTKPKDSSLTVRNDTEKQQILTFKKLEPANVQ